MVREKNYSGHQLCYQHSYSGFQLRVKRKTLRGHVTDNHDDISFTSYFNLELKQEKKKLFNNFCREDFRYVTGNNTSIQA